MIASHERVTRRCHYVKLTVVIGRRLDGRGSTYVFYKGTRLVGSASTPATANAWLDGWVECRNLHHIKD